MATKLDIVGHKPLSPCIPRSLQGAAPTITGWLSTIMLQSGDTARLPCHIEGDTGSHSVVWRDAQGNLVTAEGRYRLEGTDLVISQASWADMGRSHSPSHHSPPQDVFIMFKTGPKLHFCKNHYNQVSSY